MNKLTNFIINNLLPLSIIAFSASIGYLCGNVGNGVAIGVAIVSVGTFVRNF